MKKIETIVKEYSSKKLKEIIEQQSDSYSESFIDFAKDELIKRGESFNFNPAHIKEIEEMDDVNLRKIIENEWNDYHLEYLEIARMEYLKRNFKNETIDNSIEITESIEKEKRYPALRSVAGIYNIYAWVIGILMAILTILSFLNGGGSNQDLLISLSIIVIGIFLVLSLLAASESIKIFIDIEENTRKATE